MAKSKTDKLVDTLHYLRAQLDHFMYDHYRVNINTDFDVSIYANSKLKYENRYSKSTYEGDRTVIIDLNRDMLLGNIEDKDVKDKKGLMLRSIYREGVRMICWKLGKPHENGDRDFEQELWNLQLKSYGKVAETGAEFHTYVCSNCRKIQLMTASKLPKTKDPSQQDSPFRTPCCNARYFYEGKKYYTNMQLQKIDFQAKKQQQASNPELQLKVEDF